MAGEQQQLAGTAVRFVVKDHGFPSTIESIEKPSALVLIASRLRFKIKHPTGAALSRVDSCGVFAFDSQAVRPESKGGFPPPRAMCTLTTE